MKERIPTKLLVLLALIIFGVAGYFSFQEFGRHRIIQSEIALLEAEQERIQKENESLRERIGYFQTESYQEQESKERLALRKPDEYVVEIEQTVIAVEESERVSQTLSSDTSEQKANYRKWFEKIFKRDL